MHCPCDMCFSEESTLELFQRVHGNDIYEIRRELKKGNYAEAIILFNRLFSE